MLIRSMVAESTAATAHANAVRKCAPPGFTFGGSICLLSFRPRIGASGERMTAPATTAPNNEPRPTSSTPAMNRKPAAQLVFEHALAFPGGTVFAFGRFSQRGGLSQPNPGREGGFAARSR